jgi:cytidylate kinase
MKHIIINVGRQVGAGGQEIGRMLAQDFEAKFYDRELLNLAAKESGFSEKFFKQNDERKGFFRSLFNVQAPHLMGSGMYGSDFSQESLFKFQSDAIRKAAEEGSCVFLGRCADYILRDFENVVNVFITASMDFRAKIVSQVKGIDDEQARKLIEHVEARRAQYYNYYTGKKWGAAESYDLCVDASLLGLEETEKLIADFIRKRLGL